MPINWNMQNACWSKVLNKWLLFYLKLYFIFFPLSYFQCNNVNSTYNTCQLVDVKYIVTSLQNISLLYEGENVNCVQYITVGSPLVTDCLTLFLLADGTLVKWAAKMQNAIYWFQETSGELSWHERVRRLKVGWFITDIKMGVGIETSPFPFKLEL